MFSICYGYCLILLIMLSDIRVQKSKRNHESVNKSNTVVSLPGITNAMKYCQTDRKTGKQSYLQTINHISENVEYGDKNTFYISKEQSKLKEMLKKMNSETLQMIDLIRPKKNAKMTSKEEMQMIADRQLDNSKKNISIMQVQIEKLEAKYNKIVEQEQEEELLNKIKEIKLDIESIKNGNVDMKFNIQKDGKQIVKEYSDGYDAKLTMLENDSALFEQRLEKLKTDNSRVIEETSKLQGKLKESDAKMQLHDQQYQKIKNKMISQNMNRNMEATLKERKYQAQVVKKKMEFQNSHLQYKYYKLLKELQAKKGTCDQLQSRQTSLIDKINKSRQQITNFEALYGRLKKQKQEKNRSVLLYLEKERKNKEEVTQLKQSMVVSNLYASRQLLVPHAISMREPIKHNRNNTQSIDETRKWQSEAQEEAQLSQLEKQKKSVNQVNGKEEIDFSTAQLKQKQHQTIEDKEEIVIVAEENEKNPQNSNPPQVIN